jgi:hypothetical protein
MSSSMGLEELFPAISETALSSPINLGLHSLDGRTVPQCLRILSLPPTDEDVNDWKESWVTLQGTLKTVMRLMV